MFLEITDVGQMCWSSMAASGPNRVTNIIFIEAELYQNYEIQMCSCFVLLSTCCTLKLV